MGLVATPQTHIFPIGTGAIDLGATQDYLNSLSGFGMTPVGSMPENVVQLPFPSPLQSLVPLNTAPPSPFSLGALSGPAGGPAGLSMGISGYGTAKTPGLSFGAVAPAGSATAATAGAATTSNDSAKPGFWGWLDQHSGGLESLAKGISGIASIWNAAQQNKIARQSLALSKQQYQTNLANSIKSYNTALEDRLRSRYAQTGQGSAAADAAIAANKL